MRFMFRKSRSGFDKWRRYHIEDARDLVRTHDTLLPNAHLYHQYDKDGLDRARIILNQYEGLSLSLTKIEKRVLDEYLINRKIIQDMNKNYLHQIIDVIYDKWILICFPDEDVYLKNIKAKKLGAVLKKLRTEKGYTVGGVADQLRINESTLRNYELGNRLPRIDILYGLSQIYKLSVDDIIKNTIK